jgi:hypothetical protein
MPEEKPKYKRPRTDAQRAGEARYKAKAEVAYSLRLNRNTDGDIIDRLERLKQSGDSVQGFIKGCIRYEMMNEEVYLIPDKRQ